MPVKNGELIGFIATKNEIKIIDEAQRKNYKMNRSEIIRMLINAGSEKVLAKKQKEAQV